jgi:glyoxylase-like metal-dependent hydrolase (beta-lactamase superfamily II)
MQEITQGVIIETQYPGVTLGAINRPHGLILVDAPARPEDIKSRRAALLTLGGGVDRLLVNLDAHPDRTLGTRAMECTIIGNERMADQFRNRPLTFKTQNTETGAEWETMNGLGTVRWNSPEITFSDTMSIYWGDHPVVLEYHPGPSQGSTWLHLPDEKILFVGDSAVSHQPPFFSQADIPVWLDTLQSLLEPEKQDYLLIGGRNGILTQAEVHQQIDFLRATYQTLEDLSAHKKTSNEIESVIPALLNRLDYPAERQEQYHNRLKWGLTHYYIRHYQAAASAEGEE